MLSVQAVRVRVEEREVGHDHRNRKRIRSRDRNRKCYRQHAGESAERADDHAEVAGLRYETMQYDKSAYDARAVSPRAKSDSVCVCGGGLISWRLEARLTLASHAEVGLGCHVAVADGRHGNYRPPQSDRDEDQAASHAALRTGGRSVRQSRPRVHFV